MTRGRRNGSCRDRPRELPADALSPDSPAVPERFSQLSALVEKNSHTTKSIRPQLVSCIFQSWLGSIRLLSSHCAALVKNRFNSFFKLTECHRHIRIQRFFGLHARMPSPRTPLSCLDNGVSIFAGE